MSPERLHSPENPHREERDEPLDLEAENTPVHPELSEEDRGEPRKATTEKEREDLQAAIAKAQATGEFQVAASKLEEKHRRAA